MQKLISKLNELYKDIYNHNRNKFDSKNYVDTAVIPHIKYFVNNLTEEELEYLFINYNEEPVIYSRNKNKEIDLPHEVENIILDKKSLGSIVEWRQFPNLFKKYYNEIQEYNIELLNRRHTVFFAIDDTVKQYIIDNGWIIDEINIPNVVQWSKFIKEEFRPTYYRVTYQKVNND